MLCSSDVDATKTTSISLSFVLFAFVPPFFEPCMCDEIDMLANSDN